MNKINEFKHLKTWCEKYYKDVGLKIHPSNVPVDVVLDELMGALAEVKRQHDTLLDRFVETVENLAKRITELELTRDTLSVTSDKESKKVKK